MRIIIEDEPTPKASGCLGCLEVVCTLIGAGVFLLIILHGIHF